MLDMHDVIITGDLNFHLDIPTQLDVKRFSATLCDRGMKQLVSEASHSKGCTAKCIRPLSMQYTWQLVRKPSSHKFWRKRKEAIWGGGKQ